MLHEKKMKEGAGRGGIRDDVKERKKGGKAKTEESKGNPERDEDRKRETGR